MADFGGSSRVDLSCLARTLARPTNCSRKVGYTIRLESSVSKDTQLVLMTPGILLKKLARDPMLKEFTHVLIDEVRRRLYIYIFMYNSTLEF